jgi:hypothetical protein
VFDLPDQGPRFKIKIKDAKVSSELPFLKVLIIWYTLNEFTPFNPVGESCEIPVFNQFLARHGDEECSSQASNLQKTQGINTIFSRHDLKLETAKRLELQIAY